MIADRYEVGREIGRGGMGSVWLGRDTVLGREVALKQIGLMPGVSSPDLERAEREARLAARLNHPHVVAVYDLVTTDDDGTWLVMEYVRGVTLSGVIKRDGALTPDEAASLVRQAADALTAAHEAGIVHRDVKPSNILVTPDGEVKLSDFGIARAEADASLTQTGLVTGSPAYLAPEVASGDTATEASDVWSLGATLYHAMAGHPPYDVTENLMGALYRIVHEDPPRLDDPGWLAPVLEHTMTREPSDRWSMRQVRDFLGQGPDVAIHPSPVGTSIPEGTQVIEATPSTPVAVTPIVADPALAARAESRAESGARRRGSPWPWVGAVAVLVALAVIGIAALTSGGSPSASPPSHTPSASPPSHTPGSSRTPSSTSSQPSSPTSSRSTPPATPRASAMRSFVSNYFSQVTVDDHATFAMLTPAFQDHSGQYGGYHGFWRTIQSATPHNLVADPAALTVTYDVDYVRTDGTTATGHSTLHLVANGASFLINAES